MFQNTERPVIEQHNPDSLVFLNNRVDHNNEVIAEYTQLMLDGFELDPVSGIRDETGQIYVWDGKLRGEAARQVGVQLSVSITAGTRLDAEWLAASANQKHGLRRTNRDKRHSVKLALLHPYGAQQSNRSLARHCGVDARTVASIRQELEDAGDIPVITNRLAQRGNGQIYQINTQPIGAATADALNYRLPQPIDDEGSLEQAIYFAVGETWNATPTQKCLNGLMNFDTLRQVIAAGTLDFTPDPNGQVPQFCPHLRLFPQYIEQVIPTGEARQSQKILDRIDCLCIDPYAKKPNSCFNQQGQTAMQTAVAKLQAEGLTAILPDEVQASKKAGNFIWLEPKLDGIPCTPERCRYTNDDPPGYLVIALPDGHYRMACRHAECGGSAQQGLIDLEAEQRREVEQQRQVAINQLRQTTVEKTLFGELNLSSPKVMEVLESILVPAWDTTTMGHVVIGWQRGVRAQLATELSQLEVQAEFEEHAGLLATPPTSNTIRAQFTLLREQLVHTDQDWSCWLACLAIVHSWRSDLSTTETFEQAQV